MSCSPTKSAATFDLTSGGARLPNDTSTCLLQVRNFYAPHSIQNVTEKKNSFFVQLYFADGSLYESYVITIPPGGYDIQSLLSAVNTSLDTQMKTYENNITFTNWHLTFNAQTGKTRWIADLKQIKDKILPNPITTAIALPCDFLDYLGFSSQAPDTYLMKGQTILGFGLQTSYTKLTSLDTFLTTQLVQNSQTSKLMNLCYPASIYITIDNVEANNVYAGSGIDVLDVLPIAGDFAFGDFISIERYSPFQLAIPHAILKGCLTIRLWDEFMKELDWQGQDWTLILGVEWGLDTHAAGLETTNITEMPRPLLFRVPGYDPLNHYQYSHGGKRIK